MCKQLEAIPKHRNVADYLLSIDEPNIIILH